MKGVKQQTFEIQLRFRPKRKRISLCGCLDGGNLKMAFTDNSNDNPRFLLLQAIAARPESLDRSIATLDVDIRVMRNGAIFPRPPLLMSTRELCTVRIVLEECPHSCVNAGRRCPSLTKCPLASRIPLIRVA